LKTNILTKKEDRNAFSIIVPQFEKSIIKIGKPETCRDVLMIFFNTILGARDGGVPASINIIYRHIRMGPGRFRIGCHIAPFVVRRDMAVDVGGGITVS
jgi:hypothetical protein